MTRGKRKSTVSEGSFLVRDYQLNNLLLDGEFPYGEIEVEIEEAADDLDPETENERSELLTFTFIHIIWLILRFVAARQQRQVIRLLRNSEIGRLFHLAAVDDDFEDDDDDDADLNPVWRRRRRRTKPDPNRFPKVPSDEGKELMNSGTFGFNEVQTVNSGDRNNIGKKKLARRILDRELATVGYAQQRVNHRLMAQVGCETSEYCEMFG